MKISELIEILEIIKEQHGDVEIGIAEQPSYPLLYLIDGITYDEEENMALVVEGHQEGYGKREWFDEFRYIEL